MRNQLLPVALSVSCLVAGCGDDGNSDSGGSSGGGTTGSTTVEGSSFPDAQEYVDAHNAVRGTVTKPKNYDGTWAPLPPVTWSDEVAETAQEWANSLKSQRDCGLQHDSGSGYGENLAGGWGLSPTSAVEMWASEESDYTYKPEYVFKSGVGHYTQIVWRTSTTIGCASADCDENSSVVVCRYSPPGNMIGGSIY